MTDLDKLIAAVEAGTLPEAVFHGSSSIRGHWAYTTGLDADQRRWAYLAYNGDLNAALRLHEALLPGWEWTVDAGDGASVENRGDFGLVYTANASVGLPARAWILAILRAIKAKGNAP